MVGETARSSDPATRRVRVHNFEGGLEMVGTIAIDADLDGVVPFTDEDNARVHQLNGWLWEFIPEEEGLLND